jgi:hypothetical protein
MRRKAQTTAEFMAIFGIALVIFTVMFIVMQSQSSTATSQNMGVMAASSALDLANAAREVHVQGRGARRVVQITLPSNYNASLSHIGPNAVVISAGNTSYAETVPFTIQGELPQGSGTHSISVENDGSSVAVGHQNIEANASAIFGPLPAGSQKTDAVRITNVGPEFLSITPISAWPSGPTQIYSVSPPSASIMPLSTAEFLVTLKADPQALGNYAGHLNFSTNASSGQKFLILPVSMQVG